MLRADLKNWKEALGEKGGMLNYFSPKLGAVSIRKIMWQGLAPNSSKSKHGAFAVAKKTLILSFYHPQLPPPLPSFKF